MNLRFCGRVVCPEWPTHTLICFWLGASCHIGHQGARARCGAVWQTFGMQLQRLWASRLYRYAARIPSSLDTFRAWVRKLRVWRRFRDGYEGQSASLTWCSLTLTAYLSVRTRSSTGTRGRQLTCFTASAAMTVSFTGALSLQRCRRSRPRPLLAGRRGL
jgi:hypothetical protein